MTGPDADKTAHPATYAEFEEDPSNGWLRTLVQFFAIPLVIVSAAVGLYLGVSVMLGTGPKSVSDYVDLLQSDTINRRWQAAYELANRLHGDLPAEFRDPKLVNALTSALARARLEKSDPPKLAVTLLAILNRLADPAAIEAVREAVDDEHPWIRSYAIRALGTLGDGASLEKIRAMASHEDPGTRQAALGALVKLDQVEGMDFRLSPKTREIARTHLSDPHEDVRFTAAIVLADAGERAGTLRVIKEMLSRKHLEELVPEERLDTKLGGGISRYYIHSNVIIQAIGAVAKLKAGDDPEIMETLSRLSDDEVEGDPDVREAARQALALLKPRN